MYIHLYTEHIRKKQYTVKEHKDTAYFVFIKMY